MGDELLNKQTRMYYTYSNIIDCDTLACLFKNLMPCVCVFIARLRFVGELESSP